MLVLTTQKPLSLRKQQQLEIMTI